MTTVETVLSFWFGDRGEPPLPSALGRWFGKDDALDRSIAARFGPAILRGLRGELDHWAGSAEGWLALIVLLDQFPRNAFRGTARAFAGDPVALRHAKAGLVAGMDLGLRPVERMFVYLPLEHHEGMAEQDESVRHFYRLLHTPGMDPALAKAGYDYALAHRAIVARFGRFPHRNALLGRASTEEEAAFLRTPGSSF